MMSIGSVTGHSRSPARSILPIFLRVLGQRVYRGFQSSSPQEFEHTLGNLFRNAPQAVTLRICKEARAIVRKSDSLSEAYRTPQLIFYSRLFS